jgi:hypothetical protein
MSQETEKANKVLLEVRKREDEMFSKGAFCREHNFNLEADKFKAIEDELRRIGRMIEREFNIN